MEGQNHSRAGKAMPPKIKKALAGAKYIGSGGQAQDAVSAAQRRGQDFAGGSGKGCGGAHGAVECLGTENTGVNDTSRSQRAVYTQPLTSNHPGNMEYTGTAAKRQYGTFAAV